MTARAPKTSSGDLPSTTWAVIRLSDLFPDEVGVVEVRLGWRRRGQFGVLQKLAGCLGRGPEGFQAGERLVEL